MILKKHEYLGYWLDNAKIKDKKMRGENRNVKNCLFSLRLFTISS
jgi:hypothetical protein